MSRYYDHYKPYVSVGARRAKAEKLAKKLATKGQKLLPVAITGRIIAKSFWGKAWCENLESYSDFANRLPRGRTYVRNGSVIDLQITTGKVEAKVSGSGIYTVKITIKPATAKSWTGLKKECGGQIGSLLELLGGKLSTGIMTTMTRRETGLFPKPAEISLDCSCPDWAGMCKHVAAVLYGVGARLDESPELLFQLRGVNHEELIAEADVTEAIGAAGDTPASSFGDDDLSSIFGIDMDPGDDSNLAVAEPPAPRPKPKPKAKPKAKTKAKSKLKVAVETTPVKLPSVSKPKPKAKTQTKTPKVPVPTSAKVKADKLPPVQPRKTKTAAKSRLSAAKTKDAPKPKGSGQNQR